MKFDNERIGMRLHSTRSWMTLRGLDCLVLYSYRSALTAHWTGYCPRHSVTNASVVLITDEDAAHFTRLPIHGATAESDGSAIPHICAASSSWSVASVDDLVSAVQTRLGGRRHLQVGFAAYPPEAGIRPTLERMLPGELQDVTIDLIEFLSPKDEGELKALRRAADVAQQAFESGLAALRVGGVAGDARKAAEAFLRDEGSRTWHCFVGATDAEGRTLLQPDESRLEPGASVFLETIPDIELYCPEVVATVFIGKIPKGAMGRDAAIRSTLSEVLRTTTSRSSFGDLHRTMMQGLISNGMRADSIFRLGHQTGLDNIELPEFLDSDDERLLGESRVISVHPNGAVSGHGTLIRGGTLVVNRDDCQPLFRFPKEPLIVG